VCMSCSVTNTGQRKGMETIQVYIEPIAPSVARPVRELKAFTKVELESGATTTVEVLLDSEAFAHWDIDANDWQVTPGEYRVHVGNSSRDLPLVGSVAR